MRTTQAFASSTYHEMHKLAAWPPHSPPNLVSAGPPPRSYRCFLSQCANSFHHKNQDLSPHPPQVRHCTAHTCCVARQVYSELGFEVLQLQWNTQTDNIDSWLAWISFRTKLGKINCLNPECYIHGLQYSSWSKKAVRFTLYFGESMQTRHKSSALAMELHLFGIKPSIS